MNITHGKTARGASSPWASQHRVNLRKSIILPATGKLIRYASKTKIIRLTASLAHSRAIVDDLERDEPSDAPTR